MHLKSWLTSLYQRLTGLPLHSAARGRRRGLSGASLIIERFESRRLLSAGPVAIGSLTPVDSFPQPNQGSDFAPQVISANQTSAAPVISGVNQTITYDRHAAPQTIAPNLTVTGSTLASATVSFTNWQGEDRVQFYNTYALQHTFTEDLVAHTAVLTITGNDTAAHYQTLLQSVVYWDVSDNPNTAATRIATFSVVDTFSQSGTGAQSIVVSTSNATNLPPVVSVNDASALAYVAPGPGIAVFSNSLISDPDSYNLTKLTIQITTGYQNDAGGHDLLSLSNQLGLFSAFDSTTGTLTLSGFSYVGNYREALKSVIFSSSGSSISTATRTLTVIATDDHPPTPALSIPVTRDITVTLDAPPLLSQIEATQLNVVGQAPVPITSTLLVADPDSANAVSATISISNNYRSGEDFLGFVNTSTITGSWDPVAGTLTLSGTDSFSNYRTALRSVTYQNTSTSPDTAATRTIGFQVSDGLQPSNSVSRDVTVRASNTSPILSGITSPLSYVEQSAPLAIAPNIGVNSLNLTSATVAFTNWQGEDRVEFHNMYALQHTLNVDLVSHTAVLTITGSDTAAHYQTLLQSVVYWDVSQNPNTSATRIAKFTLTDVNSDRGSGSLNLTVSSFNNPPVVSVNDSTPLSYVAPGPGIAPFSNVLVTDPDSTYLSSLTVQITSGYQNDGGGHDLLSFTNQLGIYGTFDASSGTLTLSSESYVSNYRQALRAVIFSSSGSSVSTTTRTLTVIATDYNPPTNASSIPVTRDITVNVAAPPVLSQIETAPLNVVGQSPVPITSTLLVADPDSANAISATISISSNYRIGEDILGFVNTPTITGSWNPTNGTLTLSGSDSVTNYRTALRSVTYQNTSTSPDTAATRTIGFQVSDSFQSSNSVSRDVTVRATNTSPVLSGITSALNYIEQSAPLAIAPNVGVNSLNLTSATVSFTNWQGEDRVDFHNIYALQHTFTEDLVAHTAVLTITGNDTAAHYQTLLQSVVYWDVSQNPNTTATRIAKFTLTDVNSDLGSGSLNLTVTAINHPPVVSVNDSTPLTYIAPGPGIAPFSNALVTDPDSYSLTQLTIQITSGYQNDAGGHDLLSITNQFGIYGTFDAASGTLTLSGYNYVGNYRQALRAVTFSSSGSSVSTTTRTLTVIATDYNPPTNASSIPVTRDITVSFP